MKNESNKVRNKVQKVTIKKDFSGQRLDNFLINYLKGVPKSKIYSIIRKGEVRVNSSRKQVFYKIKENDLIRIPPLQIASKEEIKAPFEFIDVLKRSIIFEDDDCLVLNKPFGIASHGGSGISFGLIEAIRNFGPRYRDCKLVHRLDKNTSGLLICAKSLESYQNLVTMMQQREISRQYDALCWRQPPQTKGTIETLIGRHPSQRTKMSVLVSGGKTAITHYELKNIYPLGCQVRFTLETGRTHQIRVHASYLKFPIIGDDVYTNRQWQRNTKNKKTPVKKINMMDRQALHAQCLSLQHPVTEKSLLFEVDWPSDMIKLRNDLSEHD